LMNKRGHGYIVHIMIGLILVGLALWANHSLLAAGSPLALKLTPQQYGVIILLTFLYSQMPDIDSQISVINKFFVSAALILIIVSFLYGWKELGIIASLILLFLEWVTHRGIVHTVFAGILLAGPLFWIDPIYFMFAFMAHIIHLLSEGQFSLFSGKGFL
jgi:hypothetical protein